MGSGGTGLESMMTNYPFDQIFVVPDSAFSLMDVGARLSGRPMCVFALTLQLEPCSLAQKFWLQK